MTEWLRKRLSLVIAAELVIVMAMAGCLLSRNTSPLSPRAFGMVGVLIMIVIFAIFLYVLYKERGKIYAQEVSSCLTNRTDTQTKQVRAGIRACKNFIIGFALILLLTLFTSGQRMLRVVVCLTVIAISYLAMRREKAKLIKLGETE